MRMNPATGARLSGSRWDPAAHKKRVDGGPGRDRTDDLFHAMEARSQLRHRPTYSGLFIFSPSTKKPSNKMPGELLGSRSPRLDVSRVFAIHFASSSHPSSHFENQQFCVGNSISIINSCYSLFV